MRSFLLSTSFFTLASAVCHHGTHLWAREEAAAEKPKFGYTGEKGPVVWHTLSEDWAKCATGKYQSPINIVPGADYLETVKGDDLRLELQEWPYGAELENLGTTIEVKNAEGSIYRDGKEYSLLQFHFHTTSEHTFEDEAYALEAHFVFQADGMYLSINYGPFLLLPWTPLATNSSSHTDKSLSVVGIPIQVADTKNIPSAFMTGVLETADRIPHQDDHTHTFPLLSKEITEHVAKSDVYQYAGSLTTPPCTEGVAWNVVKEPLYVMPSSYRKAKDVMKFNARYTQSAPGTENLIAIAQ